MKTARMMAGIPALNAGLYKRIRFLVGDPVALIEVAEGNAPVESTLILRDIEIQRARTSANANNFACPADFRRARRIQPDRRRISGEPTTGKQSPAF